jgi:hypothetical protein
VDRRPRVWLGAILVAYAIYRATAALLNDNLLGLVPAAVAALVGGVLLWSARARALGPRSGA